MSPVILEKGREDINLRLEVHCSVGREGQTRHEYWFGTEAKSGRIWSNI